MFSLMDHSSVGLMKIILLDTQKLLGDWQPNVCAAKQPFSFKEGERAKYKEFIKEGRWLSN